MLFDPVIRALIPPVAWWIFLSGLDDLLIDAWFARLRSSGRDAWKESLLHLSQIPEKKIAMFVPCWHEQQVIEGMIDHNIAAIDYQDYDIFLGVYPNDARTLEQACLLEDRYPRVHKSICPEDGPTNKADCLNWIFQRMTLQEEAAGTHYQVIVQHDAEDIIHPKAFKLINRLADDYDMMQIPVFPLEMSWRHFTHGTYCDEFAEYQVKDIFTRQAAGGFLPSAGVGTAFRREALEEIATHYRNQIFNVNTLTEDYEIGLKFGLHGKKQVLVREAIAVNGNGHRAGHRNGGNNGGQGNGRRRELVATREYFPDNFAGAVRQKSRWVMGIALQTWAERGWGGPLRQLYWLWRDRKGLIGNLVTMAGNLIFLYCLAMSLGVAFGGETWQLQDVFPARGWFWWLLAANTFFLIERVLYRFYSVRQIYGAKQAWSAMLRIPWGNFINFASTVVALYTFTLSRVLRRNLDWAKTLHAFPTREQLTEYKRRLGDLLLENRVISASQLEHALKEQDNRGSRLGQILVRLGYVAEEELLLMVGKQQNLEVREVDPYAIDLEALRRLPQDVARRHRVVPFSFVNGSAMAVASPDVLSDDTRTALEAATGLKILSVLTAQADFHFVFERAYGRLVFDPSGKVRLGEALVLAGFLTPAQLEQSLRDQKHSALPLAEILLVNGWVQESQVHSCLQASGRDFRRITVLDANVAVQALIPRSWQRQLLIMPLQRRNGLLEVATGHPRSDADRSLLERTTACRIEWIYVPPGDITAILDGSLPAHQV